MRDIAGHHGALAELLDGPGGVGLKVRVTFAPVEATVRNTRAGRA